VYQIRPMQPEDYDDLIALWNAAGLDYRPNGRDRREKLAREIAGPTSVFLVAESEGRMVGVVLGTHDGRKGWINRLAVAPSHREQGIGRALVEAAEERLEGLGIGIITCLIEDWNEGSLAFFERIGYVRHPDIVYLSKRRSPDT